MTDLYNVSEIKKTFAKHHFRTAKSLGQNFLIDPQIPKMIAAAAIKSPECCVLEIGPGIGCLTVELALLAKKVISIEFDSRLIPILHENLKSFDNILLMNEDIKKVDFKSLVDDKFDNLEPIVCANIPYNITTPLLKKLIDCHCFKEITVMIQKEVANRICASPGNKEYSSFSLFCQYYTKPQILFNVPKVSFFPVPKVDSAVVQLEMRSKSPVVVEDEQFLFRVIRAAFNQRRKTLLNSLSSAFACECAKEDIRNAIFGTGIDANVRGEQLSLSDFAKISDALIKVSPQSLS